MDPFGQKIELVLLIVSTLASVLALIVWLLNSQREQGFRTLEQRIKALETASAGRKVRRPRSCIQL